MKYESSGRCKRFAFGRNWQRFLESGQLSERLASARNELLGSLRLATLAGKRFLDIGSGSGIHSLAAFQAGAERIVSFDYDRDSVAATRKLHALSGSPANWSVLSGSVLDADFMRSLEPADVVYSWGVLHHTGDVWSALRNAAVPLKPDGVFLIALYSLTAAHAITLGGDPGPEHWLRRKRQYVAARSWLHPFMEARCVWEKHLAAHARTPAGLWAALGRLRGKIRDYGARGMSFWVDNRDWIGGWPMEYVRERDCLLFCRDELGLEPLWLKTGRANTEFGFRPVDCGNYWDAILARRERRQINPPFEHLGGHMYSAAVPPGTVRGSGEELRICLLYEDAALLDYPDAYSNAIESFGLGRYRHEAGRCCFSASDNSDPNSNGRVYTVVLEPAQSTG